MEKHVERRQWNQDRPAMENASVEKTIETMIPLNDMAFSLPGTVEIPSSGLGADLLMTLGGSAPITSHIESHVGTRDGWERSRSR
jgi:hypothetical protein